MLHQGSCKPAHLLLQAGTSAAACPGAPLHVQGRLDDSSAPCMLLTTPGLGCAFRTGWRMSPYAGEKQAVLPIGLPSSMEPCELRMGVEFRAHPMVSSACWSHRWPLI